MRFDVCEILLAPIFRAAFFHQTVSAAGAIKRVLADARIEFPDPAAISFIPFSLKHFNFARSSRCDGAIPRHKPHKARNLDHRVTVT